MVTTRRGAQRQDNTEASQGAVPTTRVQRGRGGAGRGRGRLAARAAEAGYEAEELQPVGIDDERNDATQDDAKDPSPEPISGGLTTEDASDGFAEEKDSSPDALKFPGGDSGGETVEALEGQGRNATSLGASSGGSDSESSKDDVDNSDGGGTDSDSDSDDDALFGPSIMDRLASSLKDALQARAGGPEPSRPSDKGGSSGRKLGVTSNPDAIQWQPELARSKVHCQDASKPVAPGAGAAKEKGLASQLLAPPRVMGQKDASSSEAAKKWFQLPATKITDEVKQELRLLRLRGAYDPKRFYKSFDETKFPKHFQIGTVMDNPQDFYSSRLSARERGSSITQELLADPAVAAARKKRYTKLQQEATRYQKVKKRKTDLVRANPKPKRPKH